MKKSKAYSKNYEKKETAEPITCWWCGKKITSKQKVKFVRIKDPVTNQKVELIMHKKCAKEFEKSGGWSELYEI